jgi:hypothetical protein
MGKERWIAEDCEENTNFNMSLADVSSSVWVSETAETG